MEAERLIGRFVGDKKGPLIICFGGIHGNEPAGVRAIELILKMLEVEPITNPDFSFSGSFVGIRGNLQALREGKRFIDRDLNRSLTVEAVKRVFGSELDSLRAEDREIFGLISTVRRQLEELKPRRVIILDLHTTTAFGGIFVLTANEEESIQLGVEMHAPVITGFENLLKGTTMGYFKPANFDGLAITTVVFESGQHNEPLSVNRAIAGIINCMRAMGCVSAADVENRHDHLLVEYTRNLPKVAKLITRYHVEDASQFEMKPDYKNFDPVEEGEILAYENGDPVVAAEDGLIIMPKYQEQGQDGFFLVTAIEGY